MLDFGRERRKFTVEEYLSLEQQAQTRSEFFQGELYAMTGGSLNHNRIVNNLARLLGSSLVGGKCEVFTSDVRLHVQAHDLFTYPDVLVICGEPQLYKDRTDTVTDATLIAEVLSPKTEPYDRGPKSDFYRSLPSLKQILLVEQSSHGVYTSSRQDGDSWLSSHLPVREGLIELPAPGLSIAVEDLYERVKL